MFVKARATWSIPHDDYCNVGGKQKTRTATLPIGIRQPVSVQLGNGAFCFRPDQENESQSRRNMIGVLALGWMYIFSAELVDRRIQENATIAYTNSRAEVTSENKFHNAIDIGNVDGKAARWWSAILAPNKGWKATIFQNGDDDPFLSPWSAAIDSQQPLKVRWEGKNDKLSDKAFESSIPVSSKQALDFIIEFCTLHGIQEQLFAALVVAIHIPAHNCYGIPALLPSPSVQNQIRLPLGGVVKAAELYEQMPYYMALSCNFHVTTSSLCGVFWEPGIT